MATRKKKSVEEIQQEVADDFLIFHTQLPAIPTKEQKQRTALEQIEELLATADKSLLEAQTIADKTKTSFSFNPAINSKLGGTYHPASEEGDDSYWYWNNSSANC